MTAWIVSIIDQFPLKRADPRVRLSQTNAVCTINQRHTFSRRTPPLRRSLRRRGGLSFSSRLPTLDYPLLLRRPVRLAKLSPTSKIQMPRGGKRAPMISSGQMYCHRSVNAVPFSIAARMPSSA